MRSVDELLIKWVMGYGLRFKVYGLRVKGYGLRFKVYGLRVKG